MSEHITEAEVAQFLRLAGVDPDSSDDMFRALAVGLTVYLWRNTCFEEAQCGFYPDIPGCPEEQLEEIQENRLNAHHALLNAMLQPLSQIADPKEANRIWAIIYGVPLGMGLPGDIMMRANTHTTYQVLQQLRHLIDPHELQLGSPIQPTAIDGWLTELCHALEDPERPISLGCITVDAEKLFPLEDSTFEEYVDDMYSKANYLLAVADKAGIRQTIGMLAYTGAAYAGHWAFTPAWDEAVKAYRDSLDAPNETDDYWTALTTTPWLLNGKQAAHLHGSPLETVHLRQAWDARRQRISPDPSRGGPFPVLF